MKAIINAQIFTMTSDPIQNGIILWQDQKIIALGSEVDIPAGTEVYDACGGVVIPGLINAHSQAGLKESYNGYVAGDDSNETAFPLTPQLNAYDGINPRDPIFAKMAAAGVTTTAVAPGNTNLLGGSVTVIKTVGDTRADKVVKEEVGIKGAMGEFPKRIYSEKGFMPRTRLSIMGLLRQTFYGAKNYSKARLMAPAGQSIPYNFMMEKTASLLDGQTPFYVHVNRCDDIHSALRLAKEFNLKLVLVNAMEAHLAAEKLAENQVSCIVSPGLKHPDHWEFQNGDFHSPQILMDAGICTAVVPDSSYLGADDLPTIGFKLRQAGMPLEQVLETMTINPARILGVDARLGSLAAGNDADMVVLNGEPFTPAGTVKWVIVNGQSLCEGGK